MQRGIPPGIVLNSRNEVALSVCRGGRCFAVVDRSALQCDSAPTHPAVVQLASATRSVVTEHLTPAEPHRIADKLHVPSDGLVLGLIAANVITLAGSMVTGRLARNRRLELADLNSKLRAV
jgi:hypothetical protein